MQSEIKDIDKQIVRLRNKKYSIEKKEFSAMLPTHRKLIGKCYRYRNSYGGEDKGWWLYGKVLSVHQGYTGPDDVMVRMETFQKCSYGNATFDKSSKDKQRLYDSWVEISSNEFNRRKKALISSL